MSKQIHADSRPRRSGAGSAMAAHGLAQGQQPPKVQIPQSGVPQIMTMEGAFVRAAYNNEGYVILGYRLANTSVGEPWMLLDVGMTLRDNVPNYKLTRDAVSLDDARTARRSRCRRTQDFQKANLMALERRSTITKDSINYFPPTATQACRIGFFAELSQRAMSWDEVELSDTRACLGKLYFPIPGGIKHGQYLAEREVRQEPRPRAAEDPHQGRGEAPEQELQEHQEAGRRGVRTAEEEIGSEGSGRIGRPDSARSNCSA